MATKQVEGKVSIQNLDLLLDRILAEYIQVSTVPSGKLLSGPVITNEGQESIRFKPMCHYQAGCPQNFADFFATPCGMKSATAFAWWSRSRLRYSCSTNVATFVRFIVPHMKRMHVEELTCLDGKSIRLEDLEIYSMTFVPRMRHALLLDYDFMGTRTEIVEAVSEDDPLCSHNFLRCRKTGVIIDITIGQFLGTMKPYIFQDMEELFASIPGEGAKVAKTEKSAIDQQVARDNNNSAGSFSPDAVPERFTKRVFRSIRTNKEFCWNCKGVATARSPLKKCLQCKEARYCCRDCQILHWKNHKTYCALAAASTS